MRQYVLVVAGEMFQHLPFPFPDDRFPPELGAVVQRTVLSGELPALEVIHSDDNSWLVGDGVNDPNEPGACAATHMLHVIERNSSVADLASLPLGHLAVRAAVGAPWTIERHEWAAEPEGDGPKSEQGA